MSEEAVDYALLNARSCEHIVLDTGDCSPENFTIDILEQVREHSIGAILYNMWTAASFHDLNGCYATLNDIRYSAERIGNTTVILMENERGFSVDEIDGIPTAPYHWGWRIHAWTDNFYLRFYALISRSSIVNRTYLKRVIAKAPDEANAVGIVLSAS
jgi:hypothetical protein